jgi:hypothetical protein
MLPGADRADRRKDPNASLRAVRENELQMSRQEFAKLIVKTSEERGEAVACAPRLVAAWEDGDVSLPRPVYRRILTRVFTERTGRRLRSATGHLTIAAGWLSYDSGRPADARSLYNDALAAARIAHDPGPLRGTPSAASRSWPRHQAVPVR